MNVSLNRRDFAKGLGGLVLAFTLDPAAVFMVKGHEATSCSQLHWR